MTCIPSSTAATREAIAVSSLFERDTPDSARTLTRSMAVDIITALFAESYSVVHIAAQGLYDETNPRRSGLTIGDDLILTANEFDQMQGLPELVFINSGHPPQTSATERVWPQRWAGLLHILRLSSFRLVFAPSSFQGGRYVRTQARTSFSASIERCSRESLLLPLCAPPDPKRMALILIQTPGSFPLLWKS